jgi:hypothetical protein
VDLRFSGPHPVIAEPHLDFPRNFIAVLGGSRRWLLAHPRSCVNMHSFPARHRLARHSSVDWSSPDLNRFPKFANVTGSEGKWGERAQKAGFSHFYTLLLH